MTEQEREKAAALAEAQKEAEPEDTESEEMESQEPEAPKEPDTIPNAEDEEVDPDMAPKLRIVLDPGHGGPGRGPLLRGFPGS